MDFRCSRDNRATSMPFVDEQAFPRKIDTGRSSQAVRLVGVSLDS
jgi:hypothetical protein